jgi:hypothetical protein
VDLIQGGAAVGRCVVVVVGWECSLWAGEGAERRRGLGGDLSWKKRQSLGSSFCLAGEAHGESRTLHSRPPTYQRFFQVFHGAFNENR